MDPLIATVVSVCGVLVSILTAVGTLIKTMSDRRHGITEHELATSRFGLDALQASITVKDTLISQLKETVREGQEEIKALRERVEELEFEIEVLKESAQ